jgi:hypothetical protein
MNIPIFALTQNNSKSRQIIGPGEYEKEPFGTQYFICFDAQVPAFAKDEPFPQNTDCSGVSIIA